MASVTGGASGASGSSSSAGSGASGEGGGATGGTNAGGSAGGGGSAGSPAGNFQFEGGAVAAVTLTYDDGLDPHLAIVQPALEAAGLRGTFFLSNFEGTDHRWALPNANPAQALTARHLAWQQAGAKGHELADHTVNHPCNSTSKAPGFKLTDYDMARMEAELDDSLKRLMRLGAAAPITFAYPCSSDTVGLGADGTDYSPLVATRFLAARVSKSGIADPATVDLLHVPQRDAGKHSGAELKAMVDEAIAAHGWLVVLFHGVGDNPDQDDSCPGDLVYAPQTCMINYLKTSKDAHQELVSYLAEKKPQVWTATFKEVATFIKSKRP
jgi:peptidoglycan/xylan/chitin deacetylase (PgdA/CDA1 family)